MTGNPRLKIFSVGLGFAVEPGKLQSITNVADGYHQVVDQLTGTTLFDLESFYFKIFTNAAGLNQVVDPTVLVDLSTLNPTVIERARIVTSDRSATFVILDEPALRQFYSLEFVSPTGVVIRARDKHRRGADTGTDPVSTTGFSASCSRIRRRPASMPATGYCS